MDPLSLAGTIPGLISLAAEVLAKCYSFGCTVANASKEMQKLGNEIASLSGVLLGLQSLVASDTITPDRQKAIIISITGCGEALQELHQKLGLAKDPSKKIGVITKLAWPLKQTATLELANRLERQKNTLEIAMVAETYIVADETRRQVSMIREALPSMNQQVFRWLFEGNYENPHLRASTLQLSGTCTWPYEHHALQEWLGWSGKPVLWMHGIPGSGKTVLASNIINYCLRSIPSPEYAVTYFYCDFREKEAQQPEAVIGALISQLCTKLPSIPESIMKTFQNHRTASGDVSPPTYTTLLSLFEETLEHLARVKIVIDGLDECNCRDKLLENLLNLRDKGPCQLSLLISSRQEMDLQRLLRDVSNIPLNWDTVNNDINRFIEVEIESQPHFHRLNKEFKVEIVDTLSKHARGMFRWVQCQLDELAKFRTRRAIRQGLRALPSDLNETYKRVLLKIKENDITLAQKALTWLIFSRRPLSLRELAEASVLETGIDTFDPESRLEDAEDILEILGCLVSYDENSRLVTLAHYTVGEYFLSSYALTWTPAYHLSPGAGNIQIAKGCLTYLLLDNLPHLKYKERLESYPLLNYAARYWTTHARRNLSTCPPLLDLAMTLLKPTTPPTPNFYSWVQALVQRPSWKSHSLPRHFTPLYFAASFGLTPCVLKLLDAGVDINARGGSYGGTALHAACWRGHPEIAGILINRGIDRDILDWNRAMARYFITHQRLQAGAQKDAWLKSGIIDDRSIKGN
ncbi:MAG: hypothetical protein M1834_005205 [Cirrosporium novae-zelandiae]|nr:MAG: hypothetical protein M1834_005205 [Cirrosporium novae-zelandiae]